MTKYNCVAHALSNRFVHLCDRRLIRSSAKTNTSWSAITPPTLFRRELQQLPVVRQHIDCPLGTHADVSNSRMQVHQQRFLGDYPLSGKRQPVEHPAT